MSEISNSIKKIGEELLNLAALFDGADTTEEPGPTLEEVRATLADISRKGKTAEMKNLLISFGASKLSDIPADKYAEVLAAAREVADA